MKHLIISFLFAFSTLHTEELPSPRSILEDTYKIPANYIDNYKIPKVLYKTGPKKTCATNKTLAHLFKLNEATSGYTTLFFDDKASRNIFEQYFAPKYLMAYDKILPSAFKADLFRLAILYLCGGVYSDLTQHFLKDPSPYVLHNKKFVTLCVDLHDRGIYNAFMASPPRHPVILYILDAIVQEILEERIPKLYLDITGPRAVHRHLKKFFKRAKISRAPTSTHNTTYKYHGRDGQEHLINVPFRLAKSNKNQMLYIIDKKSEPVIQCKYREDPSGPYLYEKLLNKQHYSDYSLQEIYN